MARCILFDLDGTLTDSGEGIMNCVEKTLLHYGITPPSREQMRFFVGPPLRTSFPKFGIPDALVEEAVRYYRSIYVPEGLFQNYPYPGIEQLLEELNHAGCRLFVATSKPEHMARAVLEHFQLDGYFEGICGSQADGIRDAKSEVIGYLLSNYSDMTDVVMVGDTAFDVLGAAAHKIPTVGVSWGYGDAADIISAGAIYIASSISELYTVLMQKQRV